MRAVFTMTLSSRPDTMLRASRKKAKGRSTSSPAALLWLAAAFLCAAAANYVHAQGKIDTWQQAEGTVIRVEREHGSGGEKVQILYPANAPDDAEIHSLTGVYIFSLIFGVPGVVIALIVGVEYFLRWRDKNRMLP